MFCYNRWQCDDTRGGCCGFRHDGTCTCTEETWKGEDGYSFEERFVSFCGCPACCPSDYESCSEYEDTVPRTYEKQMLFKRWKRSQEKRRRQEEHEEAESAERKRQRKGQESQQSGCHVM